MFTWSLKTKKENIEDLKKKGYGDLWVVDNHLTDIVMQTCTSIWAIFGSEKDANDWIKRCLNQKYMNVEQEFVVTKV